MNFLSAIILAAGRGERMRAGQNKALLPLSGRPVLCYALDMWRGIAEHIIIAAQPAEHAQIEALLDCAGIKASLVAGGTCRAASLVNALAILPPQTAAAELIAVHDAARPLTHSSDIARVIAAAHKQGAAILAAPVTDTIRYQDEEADLFSQNQADGLCGELLPRERLLAAQTPQIFRRDWLTEAYAGAKEGLLAMLTDDAALLQAQGRPCAFVWAEYPNPKLTKPEDMLLAEALIKLRRTEGEV